MAQRTKRLVLNVDCDEARRGATSGVLRQADFDVGEARTGSEALQLAAGEQPDLILLDVHLPDIEGFEVCRRLKSRPETSLIPVLYLAACPLDSSQQPRVLDFGADGYLTEPFDPGLLVASVKSMLRMRDAEREVRRYAKAWQSTFDSIQDGIAVLDSQGCVIQANARFRVHFSDGALERMIAYESPPIALKDIIGRVEKSGRHVKWEVTQGEASLEISLNGIQDSSETRGVICIVRDVTERNRIEENLRFTQKLESVGLLAGGIAHDFNNLLTGILGNASLALDEPGLPSGLRPMLQQVVTSSERAADLTRQLLAYAGKGRFHEEPVDISTMVRETLSLIRTNLAPNEVKLALDPALPLIRADATQMRQLLMNLILNASEAIGQKSGLISIRTAVTDLGEDSLRLFPNYSLETGKYVSVEVLDSGSGMDAATLKRIFDPFFTTKFLGRGLGLSATLGIVRSHRGAIRVVSEPEKGSLFHVVLPVIEAKDETQAPPDSEPDPITARILIVEDEESVRSMMRSVLERDGHAVLSAVNGFDGIQVYRAAKGTIDLVIVDLTMPVMSGEETIEGLIALDPAVSIVVCTGHSTSDAAKFSAGILGVIGKPFRGSVLRSEVRKYLLKKMRVNA
jgi:DNA-binding response OmpR family regulator